jgi:hypothetical protein
MNIIRNCHDQHDHEEHATFLLRSWKVEKLLFFSVRNGMLSRRSNGLMPGFVALPMDADGYGRILAHGFTVIDCLNRAVWFSG